MNAVERMQAAWCAEYATQLGDEATGVPRPDAIQACQVKAWLAAKEIGPGEHPIDPHLTAAEERWHKLLRPLPDTWWVDLDRVREARTANTVRLALKAVRSGWSPREAGKLARHIARELPSHCQDAAELKVYHYCRLAGLME